MGLDDLTAIFQSGDMEQVRTALDDVIEQQDPKVYKHFLQKGKLTDGVPKPHKSGGLVGKGAGKVTALYAFLTLTITAPEGANVPKPLQADTISQLNLTRCKFTELPPELGSLHALTELDLSYNKLTDLPQELGQLKQLERVNLDGNKFKALPEAVCGWEKLTHLSLDGTPLKTLSPSIGNMTGLTSLYIRNAKLKQIPELAALTNLERCVLINLPLTSLPEGLASLAHFRRIDIADCPKLTSVPQAFWEMETMEVLYLYGLPIPIPPHIAKSKSLMVLGIDANHTGPLPPELGQLTSLESLSIHNIQQDTLPPEVGQLEALKELSIEHGTCHSLPDEIGQLPQLKRLRIHYVEELSTLPALVNNKALEEIDIYDVPLQSMPDTSHLKHLKTVKAENTQLPEASAT